MKIREFFLVVEKQSFSTVSAVLRPSRQRFSG